MESNQSTIEEVASDNIVEREVQPPKPLKRKKKKMSFTAWWALHGSEELKTSTENVEQQDSSLVLENASSAKALQKVDEKGDEQPPRSESNENNEVPLNTCSGEDIPSDQDLSAGNIKKQNVSVEESIGREQETVHTTEKEQPSKSEEQPPKRRRNKMKVKMIPWSLWLEKYGPAELRTPAKSTGTEDDSLVTEQESIFVLKETQEKEESSKSSTEIMNQNTSLPVEDHQENSFKTEICKEELVSFTSEPLTEKKSVTVTQKKVNQKGEKQSKTKRNKKTPLLWKSFPEPDACIDLTFFAQNSDINGPLSENQSHQAGLPKREKKTLWKMLPKSEPCIDVSFFAQNIEVQNVSMPAEERDEVASMKKKSSTKNTVISATELATEKKSVTATQKKVDQKVEKQSKTRRNKKTPLLWKSFPEPDACIDLTFFAQNSDINCPLSENQSHQAGLPRSERKTLWKMFPKSEPCIDVSFFAQNIDVQNVSKPAEECDEVVSMKKESSTKNTMISATEPVTEKKSVTATQKKVDQKGKKQSKTKLNKKKIPFHIWLEKHAATELTTSGENTRTEDDSLATEQESITLLNETPEKEESSSSTENVMNQEQKHLMKQLNDMSDVNQKLNAELKQLKDLKNKLLSERRQRKSTMVSVHTQSKSPVGQSVSTQTENRFHLETVHKDISTQTEQFLMLRKEPSKTYMNRHQDRQTKVANESATRDGSQLKAVNDENVSEITKLLSLLQIVDKDQTETIENKIHTNEKAIGEVLQVIKEETVSIAQQNGDHQDEKRQSKKSKSKLKRKAATSETSDLESLCKKAKIQLEDSTVDTTGVKRAKRKIRRKAAARDAFERKAVNDENVSDIEKVLSLLEIVGDQTESIENEIHTKETAIGEVLQVREEEKVSIAQQSGDHQDEEMCSKESKRKTKRKEATRDASVLENLCKKARIQQEVYSVEKIGYQTAFIKNDIFTIETAISKELQVTKLESVVNQNESDQHFVPISETTNPDSERIPAIPQIAPEQTEKLWKQIIKALTPFFSTLFSPAHRIAERIMYSNPLQRALRYFTSRT